jgi:hypothetical protein
MRWLSGLVITVIVLAAAYYGSALYCLSRLITATRAGDVRTITAYAEIPRLSRSLGGQIVAAYLDRIGATRHIGPMERTLAQGYGATVADVLVSKMLTPERLAQILKTGRIEDGSGSAFQFKLPPLGDLNAANIFDLLWRLHFVTPVTLELRIGKSSTPDGTITAVLHRSGFRWKLTGIQLPRRIAAELAARLPTK